jgi:hypothetical protein
VEEVLSQVKTGKCGKDENDVGTGAVCQQQYTDGGDQADDGTQGQAAEEGGHKFPQVTPVQLCITIGGESEDGGEQYQRAGVIEQAFPLHQGSQVFRCLESLQ